MQDRVALACWNTCSVAADRPKPCSVAADDVEADHADDMNCFFLEPKAVQVLIGVLSRIKAVVGNTDTFCHT